MDFTVCLSKNGCAVISVCYKVILGCYQLSIVGDGFKKDDVNTELCQFITHNKHHMQFLGLFFVAAPTTEVAHCIVKCGFDLKSIDLSCFGSSKLDPNVVEILCELTHLTVTENEGRQFIMKCVNNVI